MFPHVRCYFTLARWKVELRHDEEQAELLADQELVLHLCPTDVSKGIWRVWTPTERAHSGQLLVPGLNLRSWHRLILSMQIEDYSTPDHSLYVTCRPRLTRGQDRWNSGVAIPARLPPIDVTITILFAYTGDPLVLRRIAESG